MRIYITYGLLFVFSFPSLPFHVNINFTVQDSYSYLPDVRAYQVSDWNYKIRSRHLKERETNEQIFYPYYFDGRSTWNTINFLFYVHYENYFGI